MSLLSIIAKFQCDTCGDVEDIQLDASTKPYEDWDLMEHANDHYRGFSLGETNEVGEHKCKKCLAT